MGAAFSHGFGYTILIQGFDYDSIGARSTFCQQTGENHPPQKTKGRFPVGVLWFAAIKAPNSTGTPHVCCLDASLKSSADTVRHGFQNLRRTPLSVLGSYVYLGASILYNGLRAFSTFFFVPSHAFTPLIPDTPLPVNLMLFRRPQQTGLLFDQFWFWQWKHA